MKFRVAQAITVPGGSLGPIEAPRGECYTKGFPVAEIPSQPSRTQEGEISVQIKVSSRHGHLSEDAQAIIRSKAEKLLHYFQRIMMIEVVVDLQDDERIVEFLLSAEHKHDFVAHERNKDVMAAVDLCLDKIEAQIRKYKEKIQNHRKGNQH